MKTTKKIKWKIIIALMQKVKSQQFSYCLATFDDWPTFSLCFFAHPPKKKKKNCHTVVLLALGCLPPSFWSILGVCCCWWFDTSGGRACGGVPSAVASIWRLLLVRCFLSHRRLTAGLDACGPGGYCVYVSMPDAGAVIRPWNDNGASEVW